MGYWAKDGSYQVDESDLRVRESISQVQEQELFRSAVDRADRYEEDKRRREQAEREFAAQVLREHQENKMREAEEYSAQVEKARREEEISKNQVRYGTNFDLRNPKDLGERRARAAFWSQRNNFVTLLNFVNGKSKKLDALWDQYSHAKTEEERLEIVEKMEKMFPTRESALRSVERSQGYGR